MKKETPAPSPLPLRLWELLLVHVTFAALVAVWLVTYSWVFQESARWAPWLAATLSALRVSVLPLALMDFRLGSRARWSRLARYSLLTLAVWECLRLPALIFLASRWRASDWVALVPESVLFALCLAGTFVRSGRREVDASPWSGIPCGLAFLNPLLLLFAIPR